MTNICLICGKELSIRSRYFSRCDRRKGLSGRWKFVECQNCEAISMMPMPTDKQLATYYAGRLRGQACELAL